MHVAATLLTSGNGPVTLCLAGIASADIVNDTRGSYPKEFRSLATLNAAWTSLNKLLASVPPHWAHSLIDDKAATAALAGMVKYLTAQLEAVGPDLDNTRLTVRHSGAGSLSGSRPARALLLVGRL